MELNEIDKLTIADMKPIAISFKKNEDDLIIYKWILSHSGYSNFIKDILREAKGDIPIPKEIKECEFDNKTDLINLNF